MTILGLYLLHGATGGWDELIFLVVPLVIVFAIGALSGRGKAKPDPEEPAPAPADEAAEIVRAADQAGAPERKEGRA